MSNCRSKRKRIGILALDTRGVKVCAFLFCRHVRLFRCHPECKSREAVEGTVGN